MSPHYVDGFDRNKLKAIQADQEVVVLAVAANPADQKKYDEFFQQITKTLQEQGLSGDDLATRRQVLLTRDLAGLGIGCPVTAVVQIKMRNVKGQWKAVELDLLQPRVPMAATQPARNHSVRAAPATGPRPAATQPAR